MRILVAEDDALYRAMFQRLLSPEYEPTFAEDGLAAWKLLQLEDAPQLVILDWLMPGMNGWTSAANCGPFRKKRRSIS